ncbi:MAG: ribonucleotide-diphosphate reductase subunit beta [Candidatus Peribacteria bacterium]|nr:MAG: ribonucleotide-diphosphate reductase subunit beta [Candidatus Peribacteria bacterium]
MTNLQANQIFNPAGNDDPSERTIIKGNTTGLFQLNAVKYNWAKSLYQVMVGNFWVPEKVKGLSEDAIQYKKDLSTDEQRAYKGILSFLIFLDSIQTVNLPNFSEYITAPEVNLILSIQAYQEAIHSQSYATILETVVDSKERNEIYYFWRDDKHLRERNEFIGGIYQDFIDHPNEKNFFRGIIGNFLLESIYFYNGFAFFDTLASQAKMVATDRMINYIRRDELTHVTIFANIINEIKKEFPKVFDEQMIYDMMDVAVKQEIKWSKHILGGKIIGMGDENVENYTRWLANKRLSLLGLNPLYKDVLVNPYKHLEVMQDNNSEKGNFFESTVTNYAQSSAMKGSWEF